MWHEGTIPVRDGPFAAAGGRSTATAHRCWTARPRKPPLVLLPHALEASAPVSMSNSDSTSTLAVTTGATGAPPDRDNDRDRDHDDIMYPSAIPFVLVHLACFAAIWTGVTWTAVAICVALYWLRIFAIGAGYHRYFSHRAYATEPGVPVRARLPGADAPRRRACCGGPPSTATTICIPTPSEDVHSPRHKRLPLQPCRLDLRAPPRPTDLVKIEDFAALSRAACGCTATSWCRRSCSRSSVFAIGGWSGPGGRVLLEHGAGLSRDLLHQLAGPCARPQALRDRRRLPQQLAAGDLHHGRGLAQQPPRLSEQRAPGLPLVGDTTRPSTS